MDLLIGSDYFWSIISAEKTTLSSGLFLVSSRIGYILTGSYCSPIRLEVVAHTANNRLPSFLVMTQINYTVPVVNWSTCSDDIVTLSANIEDFWNLETLGIRNPLGLPNWAWPDVLTKIRAWQLSTMISRCDRESC